MSDELNVYACRSCEHTQFGKTKPISCEQCGGSLSEIHGVKVIQKDSEGGGVKKYAHELSRQSRDDHIKESILSSRGYGD